MQNDATRVDGSPLTETERATAPTDTEGSAQRGCPECLRVATGDCGRHGPVIRVPGYSFDSDTNGSAQFTPGPWLRKAEGK